jgi:ubiquinone/menaquinone biosynthesis C-methylase UbiE
MLTRVVRALLAKCGETSDTVAVDLGCGSGQVTVPLARSCRHVVAIDIDTHAIELLSARATREAVTNIQAVVHPAETLDLGSESVDLVVSNYALHHLRDADKRMLIERSFRWLRPGGRLVIGDMMFGRGADPADREIIWEKVRELIRRGPGGWWRIVKNGSRFLLRLQEKPLRPGAWESIIREAGFTNVRTSRVVAEACVISATKLAEVALLRNAAAQAAAARTDRFALSRLTRYPAAVILRLSSTHDRRMRGPSAPDFRDSVRPFSFRSGFRPTLSPMRLGPDRVGSRGLLLLAVTGLVGIGLAVHGYGHGGVVVAAHGPLAPAARSSARASAASRSTSPSSKAGTSSSSAPSHKVGPLLSSTQYAPYAFRIYPGPETTQARQATAGFAIGITPRGGTIKLSVSASGQGAQTSIYPAGDRVYFIEATLSDESGGTDYNFGDDGVIVTNAQGHVVQ